MIYVKMKTKDVRFSIPIPNALLNVAIRIVCLKFFQKYAAKWTKEHAERKKSNFTFSLIDKKR